MTEVWFDLHWVGVYPAWHAIARHKLATTTQFWCVQITFLKTPAFALHTGGVLWWRTLFQHTFFITAVDASKQEIKDSQGVLSYNSHTSKRTLKFVARVTNSRVLRWNGVFCFGFSKQRYFAPPETITTVYSLVMNIFATGRIHACWKTKTASGGNRAITYSPLIQFCVTQISMQRKLRIYTLTTPHSSLYTRCWRQISQKWQRRVHEPKHCVYM